MKNEWEIKFLGEVCSEIFAGGDVPKDRNSKYKTDKFNVPIFSNGATNDGLYGYTDIPRVTEKSITVSARGTIGYSVIRKENYLPVVRLIVLIPNKKIISISFLKYVIETMDFGNSGSSIPQLTVPMIKKYKSPIPPLQEQHQIVAILDEAFAAIDQAIANIEKNIVNAQELFQSKLNEIFSQRGEGWEEKTLGEVFIFRQGIQRGVKLQSENKKDGQIRFLRIVDYTQGNEMPRYIDNPGEQYILNKKDISLVRYGASTGFVCKGLKGALANNLFRVIPKEKFDINSVYLYYYLASPVFQKFIKSKMGGAAMPAISFGMISKVLFPIPSIEEQKRISIKAVSLENKTIEVATFYNHKLEHLQNLKKSILQKAFAGELTNKAVEVSIKRFVLN